MAGRPAGWTSLWECRAAQSRQAHPEEVQEPSWGAAKVGSLTVVLSSLSFCNRFLLALPSHTGSSSLSLRKWMMLSSALPGRGACPVSSVGGGGAALRLESCARKPENRLVHAAGLLERRVQRRASFRRFRLVYDTAEPSHLRRNAVEHFLSWP